MSEACYFPFGSTSFHLVNSSYAKRMLAVAITIPTHLSVLEMSECPSRAHTDFPVPVLVQSVGALTPWSIDGLRATSSYHARSAARSG